MLSYQHGYHAGNFADVLKHSGLTLLLNYLLQKEKPLFYLETHSGKGLYDLYDRQATKTDENKQGIQLVWPDRKKLPGVFDTYINSISKININHELRYYPGSPALIIDDIRPIDRAYFCELHPGEYDSLCTLKKHRSKDMLKKIHFSNTDGIEALSSLLPPPEKRALVFIDPSYEIKEEYKTIPQALENAVSKFSTGVYCLWYPVVNQRSTDQLLRRLKRIKAKHTVQIEFHLNTHLANGMTACGLWLINPPFTFAAEMRTVCDTLKKYFGVPNSSYIIEVNEG